MDAPGDVDHKVLMVYVGHWQQKCTETIVIGVPQTQHTLDPRAQRHIPASLCQIHSYQALMCRLLHPPPHTTAQE